MRMETAELKRILLEREMRNGASLSAALDKLLAGKHKELFADVAPEKKAKYRNEITWLDGYCFRSRKEANYYIYLKQLHAAGEITGYGVQSPKFILTCGDGKDSRAITWTADFIVFNKDGTYEIVDTKGKETAEFKRIMKMMREKYPGVKVSVEK